MGSPILGIIVAIPLQALNFVIAAFSPNIHAVRLNFLEFFGKFYETGSKEYKPFKKKPEGRTRHDQQAAHKVPVRRHVPGGPVDPSDRVRSRGRGRGGIGSEHGLRLSRRSAAALAMGTSAIAAGWAQARIGSAGQGTLAERPEERIWVITLTALPEIIVLLGFVTAILLNG